MDKTKYALTGAASGLLNGLFGSGGGLIAVPLLEKYGTDTKSAHAESLALMLPISVISAIFYSIRYNINYPALLILIPFGLIGAAAGTFLMKKVRPESIKIIFGTLMLTASLKILF